MHFLYLWPLFLLILIPVIVIMYLLKQKAEQKRVSSLFLWKEMYENRESETPFEKLKKNKLLIIQIITVLVLVFVLMSPYHEDESTDAENVILLIDNSGSMSTLLKSERTRLDYAKNAAKEYVKSLPDNVKITVIACSERTSVAISNSVDKQAVISAINKIEGTALKGNCAAGINLAAKLNQSSKTSVAAFTDSAVVLGDLNGTVYNFSSDAENTSIDYVSSTKKDDSTIILINATNHGTLSYSGDINLYGDGKILDVLTVNIPAGETKTFYYEPENTEFSLLTAELNNADALSFDNTYYALNDSVLQKKVLLFTEKNIYLKKAIELNENIILHETDDPETFSGLKLTDYDLYIFDGQDMIPDVLPEDGNLLFINCETSDFFTDAETYENIYLNLSDSVVTHDIYNFSFGVTKTFAVTLPVNSESFITIADKSAGFICETDERKYGYLGFDLHSSDFPLDYRFPILMWNLISELSDTSVLSELSLYTGESVTISNTGTTKNIITYPDGKTSSYPSISVFTDTVNQGFYTVKADDGSTYTFSVNFDISESGKESVDSTTQSTGNVVNVSGNETQNFDIRTALIIVLLLIMAIEWIVYIKD